MKKVFLNGFEVVSRACQDAGASFMFGYPITPSSDILNDWVKLSQKNKKLDYLQTEDEISAGFSVCGAIIAGKKAFTATSGPGTVLMQDALSMAEGMRLPFVAIIGQRGGPSSGTVIYSQQELNLAIHGGNGEGMRIVYSPSNLKELYRFTRYAFNSAWKYKFPAIVLTDGYLLKTKQDVSLLTDFKNEISKALVSPKTQKNIRNIYTIEEELCEKIKNDKKDFDIMAKELNESELYKTEDAKILLISHGIVASSTRDAVDLLRKQGIKAGLFRPCTLSPFSKLELNKITKKIKRVFIIESSLGQLKNLVKQNLENEVEIKVLQKPAVGIESQEIVEKIKSNL